MTAEAGGDAILFERLAKALPRPYILKREIARGGMGIVYCGHDTALDRPVAVKLLMPEHASATLAQRFVREAKILAHLRHPGIVTVHQVVESDGLFFYVMEWLEGETLQDRLTHGALSRADVIRVGTDLLDALGAAHKQGWIHRDVKPGNIFLTGERAVLTDFGIARPENEETTSLTETRQLIGTLAYMSPEQREGRTLTRATDIYSVGLVLYEMASGRRWWQRDEEDHDWTGVPSRLRRIIRKALEPEPGERWSSAETFRDELSDVLALPIRYLRTAALIILALGFAGFIYARTRDGKEVTGRIIQIQKLEPRGAEQWSDSIGRAVTANLAAYPDLVVSGPLERRDIPEGPGLVLTGTVELIGDRLRATVQSRPGSSILVNETKEVAVGNWRVLADSLAYQLVLAIYRSDVDPTLPKDALPRTPAGLRAWSRAEPLFTQARWGEANLAYREAEQLDPTCLLCSFRINDIDRWLDQPHDSARLARLQLHSDVFPPHYRLLIRAAAARWPERIALMDSAVRIREFFLASFHRGDEIFHRGPLFGRHRREAIADLEHVVRLRPDFAPGWEHLAWLKIAEGDSGGAAQALAHLTTPGTDATTIGLRFLIRAAFEYRFVSPEAGDAIVTGALQQPGLADFPFLAMGPRLMLTFDAPAASIGMGRIFARRASAADIQSGLLSTALGHLAYGRPDSALRYARVLKSRASTIETDLFAAQLSGALALADPDTSAAGLQKAIDAREELRQFIVAGARGDDIRRRAAWMMVLLAERTGARNQAELAHQVLGQDPSGSSRYYLALLQADQLATRGRYDSAVALTDWSGDDLVRLPDPFFSAISHFLRADWLDRQGNRRDAVSALLWHEANDFGTYPIANVLAPEIDLAFGTLARWNQARMLDQTPAFAADACRGYRAVERLWRHGDAVHRARAELAAQRLTAPSCDGG